MTDILKKVTKNIFTLFIFLFVLISLVRASDHEINIVYPKEASIIHSGATDSVFIFGQVSEPDCKLKINKFDINVYPNGSFLAFLPVQYGDFVFHCESMHGQDTLLLERNVFIPFPIKSTADDSLLIEVDSVQPGKDLQLIQNDLLRVLFKGTPENKAFFSISGLCKDIPMTEIVLQKAPYWGQSVFGENAVLPEEQIKGIYTGSYRIQSADSGMTMPIMCHLVNNVGDTIVATSKGTLTILDARFPRVAELTPDMSNLRTAPGSSYYYFLPKGVKLLVTGQQGSELRVKLSDNEEAWVHESYVQMLPDGTLPPLSKVSLVRTKNLERKTRVHVFTGERIPFRIEQKTTPQSLVVNFYGIQADTDWIRYDFSDKLIRTITWKQVAKNVYQLNIELNQEQQWGYNAGYDEGDNFYLDIKKTPKIAGWPSSPLKNISILLDPGHGPDTGAVGPTGFMEKDANLLLAHALGSKLKSKNAKVYYTRYGKAGITLRGRMKLAALLDADITLSLHHNALPDGVNPFTNHGTSSYYYFPQSYALASVIQNKLLEKLKLKNYGLFFDNLAMCRIPQMPTVLLEPAFLMFPEEEMLILSKKYRNDCSDAIVDALEEFLHKSK